MKKPKNSEFLAVQWPRVLREERGSGFVDGDIEMENNDRDLEREGEETRGRGIWAQSIEEPGEVRSRGDGIV